MIQLIRGMKKTILTEQGDTAKTSRIAQFIHGIPIFIGRTYAKTLNIRKPDAQGQVVGHSVGGKHGWDQKGFHAVNVPMGIINRIIFQIEKQGIRSAVETRKLRNEASGPHSGRKRYASLGNDRGGSTDTEPQGAVIGLRAGANGKS